MEPNQKTTDDTFYVGLCMAGAVSAGAYTAGVIDYLLEALSEWEKRRGQPGVPTHKVQIPVLGGASAGGMTSVIAACSLNNPITPVDKPTGDLLAEHPENKLYHSWVDLTNVDMFSQMLDATDIKPGAILSGLNSSFINDVADRVVAADVSKWQPLPAFIKPGLKIFTTLSNLQGYTYSIPFNGASATNREKYSMTIHNDYACFELTEEDIKGDNNGWIPLNLKSGLNKTVAANAAMSTGAFPVGLKSRMLNRDSSYVNANPWLKKYLADTPLKAGNYQSLNVDGGLINNEPFDRVRDVLIEETKQSDPNDYNDYNKFSSTILMVEPFPTVPPDPISYSQGLLNVMGLTLSSMISQMRAKPLDLENALNDYCAGQYLITPARIVKAPDGTETEIVKAPDGTETELAGERAIACGAMSGFSGFLNKEFRVHDYFLGRYNCKIFLRDYFTIPLSAIEGTKDKDGKIITPPNPIFSAGYAGIDLKKYQSTKQDAGYQIIPVFEDATDYAFPDFKFSSGTNWPTIKESDIDRYQDKLKTRLQTTILNLAEFGWLTKSLLWVGAKVVLNRKISNMAMNTIKSALADWKLLPEQTKK